MPSILFLLFRRMRTPLIVVIAVYAISVLGFVLIPGQDDQGNIWHMDFFHAFYFVSFMGSTIGFGEIPYPFTDQQRMWTLVTIYGTVVAWLYCIGFLLSIIQDQAFQRVVRQSAFARKIRHRKEPFYLVCGYGDTGGILVKALTSRGIHVVVIDIKKERIDDLLIEDLDIDVPCLVADAAEPDNLVTAGLNHKCCAGLIALTNDEQANLSIALSGRLLAPRLPVICRAEHQETSDNMDSFGTDYTINPFETYADLLALAINSPYMRVLYEWLTSPEVRPICPPLSPPIGRWVICGYGRFGKALCKHLALQGVETVIVEATPEKTNAPDGTVRGKGTEAVTLREAGVTEAKAIVAGTNNGADNLSILLTARQMNPDLFIVARQTLRKNTHLFEAAEPNLIIQPARVVARKVLAIIQNPLLSDFLELARQQDNDWARDLLEGISHLANGKPVDTWNIQINESSSPAVCDMLDSGKEVNLIDIMRNPCLRENSIYARVLLLKRKGETVLLPGLGTELKKGDQLLMGGLPSAQGEINWTIRNHNILNYTITGNEQSAGVVWRWVSERRE